MYDLFANLYENLMYDAAYQESIYNVLYDLNSYAYLFFICFGLALAFVVLFYWVWRNPYGKLWQWIVWGMLSAGFGGLLSYSYILKYPLYAASGNNNCPPDVEVSIADMAYTTAMNYSLHNVWITIVLFVALSFVCKHFSTNQKHLPF